MEKLSLAVMFLLLTSCSSFPSATEIGEGANRAEEALCPLTTVKNIEGVIVGALKILPFFADWELICV